MVATLQAQQQISVIMPFYSDIANHAPQELSAFFTKFDMFGPDCAAEHVSFCSYAVRHAKITGRQLHMALHWPGFSEEFKSDVFRVLREDISRRRDQVGIVALDSMPTLDHY